MVLYGIANKDSKVANLKWWTTDLIDCCLWENNFSHDWVHGSGEIE